MFQMHQSQRVLIVDDERTITDTLVTIFSGRGYETRGVYSAEEARKVILDWPPDLAIIDVRLPGMNGVDLAILLKAEHPSCRLTLFSGHTSTAELLEFAESQGHHFDIVAKPIHPEELLDWAAESTNPEPKSLSDA